MRLDDRVRFHAIGDWSEGNVITRRVADGRLQLPAVETVIEDTWQETIASPGTRSLFDGPICRLEHWSINHATLDLSLSLTSYRIFVGTHLSGPQVYDTWGAAVMANPLGVSSALETADGYLMLGRRNQTVAYYPGRIHPFAGSMDPGDEQHPPNVFVEARRELREEIRLDGPSITNIRCVGLVEDVELRHPELIFRVSTNWPRSRVEDMLDRGEHSEAIAVATDRRSIATLLTNPELTPVASATVLLWGRSAFGDEWMTAIRD